MGRRRVAVLVLLGALVFTTASATESGAWSILRPTARRTPPADVSEAQWILSAQLADGAIAHHADRREVWPYLANFAALGLARATEVSGNRTFADAAWRWLAWYQRHQDANGYVTDYVIQSDGTVTSKGDMDSTDAYAGTFLLAARRTWLVTGDRPQLQALAPGIAGAVRAVLSTQDVDGLTWAKPAWRVKYLMDQAEAYAGLQAAADLAKALRDDALAKLAGDAAQRMATGVGSLWNPATGAYDWAVHDTGRRQATDWSIFYSDAQQQMWAVAFGLTDTARAQQLVARFAASHPDWDRPTATDRYTAGTQAVGYWPVAGWAFARAGDVARADRAATALRDAARAQGQAWPYTTATAGQLLTLATRDSV